LGEGDVAEDMRRTERGRWWRIRRGKGRRTWRRRMRRGI
jgi:hypothetical protein